MPENAFIYSDQNDLICQKIVETVKYWPRDENPECKPSAVCYAVAESGVCTYHECSPQLAILLQEGRLKFEPDIPVLGEVKIEYSPGKPGFYIP